MSTGLIESARDVLAGLLELGHTRFELFSTELREELTRLAAAIIGGLAAAMFGATGLAFGAVAIILSVHEANRLAVTVGVAVFFLVLGGITAWRVRRLAGLKPRPFDATLTELRHDLTALKP